MTAYLSNKRLGTEFEREVVDLLASQGWWVHFISPDATGAQPFDVIAVKDNLTVAIDCKTSVKRMFNISRLEINQRYAFDKWLACGNTVPIILVKYLGVVCFVSYEILKKEKSVDLQTCMFERGYYGIYGRKQNTD